jgi:hypothetical protein
LSTSLFFSLVVTFVGLLFAFRVLLRGYYAALVPIICLVGYALLSVDWVASGSNQKISELRDLAWSLVEVGLILGYSITIYTIFRDCEEIGIDASTKRSKDDERNG